MQHETLMVPLVMFGWIPLVLLMFACMPPRRAAILGFLLGWMFLPNYTYDLSGVPDYTKTTAATLAVFLGAIIFDGKTLAAVRPSLADLPVIAWCLCPFASSMTNGLGAYDGVSGVLNAVVTWGLPYLIGRAYLKDLASFRELAVLLFISGLIYAPLCLWEIRMSPQLNRYLYGFGGIAGNEYHDELGAWGSRPRVFMSTGLAVGTFMTAASLAGVWIWKTRTLRSLWGYSAGSLVTVSCGRHRALQEHGCLITAAIRLGQPVRRQMVSLAGLRLSSDPGRATVHGASCLGNLVGGVDGRNGVDGTSAEGCVARGSPQK